MSALSAVVLWGITTPAASLVTVLINQTTLTSDYIYFSSLLQNYGTASAGPFRYELWATTDPYFGVGIPVGYKVWQQVAIGGAVLPPNGNRGETRFGNFPPPPSGTYYFAILTTEYQGGPINDGYAEVDYHLFHDPITYLPSTFTPQVGLWWNPTESGSGYAIDLQHGVVVVTIYSYNSDGTPQWYLMSAPLSNNTVSGPLTKFRAGQCISCTYQAPVANGNDGTMTIVFTSATTAAVTLPGSRSFTIVTPSY
jgi:hypothetical protein